MSAPTPPTADPPGRSHNASLKRAQSLLALLTALADAHPTDPERVAAAACRPAGCDPDPLRDSLVWALGVDTTDARARALRRIAGNRDALKAGRPVLETTATDTPGWGVVQFVSVEPAFRTHSKTGRRERVLEVTARPLTGPPCPDLFVQPVSAGLLRYLARQIGFTRSRGKRPLVDDHEVSGLRVLAWFAPGESGRVRMRQYFLPSTLRKWNVDLLTLRQRRDPARFVCPLSRPPGLPCWKCAAGRDRCPAACRPRTLVERVCACGQPWWADPALPADAKCPRCRAKEES